ncbi:hypothetical protein Tco_0834778 [Tanacetum coccineum]
MAELISKECVDTAQTKSNLAKNTNDDIKLSKEYLMELQNNAYHGMFDEDVVDHIAKVHEILDLIKIPSVDSHQLRMKVFPLSLAVDAKRWWISEGDGKITTWEELIEKFFRNELRQMKSKDDNKNDVQPNKRVCKAEKFEAIKYSLGPNEEYIAIRRCEYNAWERNEDCMSQSYQEIFQKKDEGWKVERTE